MQTMARTLGILLVILAVACQEADNDAPPESAWLARLAEPSLTEEWRIGKLDGSPEYVFGNIGGVDLDSASHLFVVDAMNDVVRVFGPDGRHIAATGREGEGPGEFIAPEKVVLDSDTVLVTDRMGRVSSFVFRDSGFVFVDTFTPEFGPWDICVLGDAIILQGIRIGSENVLHTFDSGGKHRASFGELNPGANLIIQETFSWGSVVCISSPPSILYVPDNSPEIRLYSPAGNMLRRDSIPGFQLTPSEARAGGLGVFQWTPPEGAHSVRSVVQLDSVSVLLQIAFRDSTIKEAGGIVELETVVWNVPTGTVTERATNVPELLTFSGNHAYAHIREPYPQIIKYRIGNKAN